MRVALGIWGKGVKELGYGRPAELKTAYDVEEWLRFHLLVDAIGMKNPDFRSEQEWRAVAFSLPGEGQLEQHHRQSAGIDVPYVELNFKTELGPNGRRLPLRVIRYGCEVPHGEIMRTKNMRTKNMLTELGYTDCEVL